MKKDFKKLQDKELENVSGGGRCTLHSSSTYQELGIAKSKLGSEQEVTYHPVITTLFNYCGGWEHGGHFQRKIRNCMHCYYAEPIGMTVYCNKRSKEFDHYK